MFLPRSMDKMNRIFLPPQKKDRILYILSSLSPPSWTFICVYLFSRDYFNVHPIAFKELMPLDPPPKKSAQKHSRRFSDL
jgi:hypothetical protein